MRRFITMAILAAAFTAVPQKAEAAPIIDPIGIFEDGEDPRDLIQETLMRYFRQAKLNVGRYLR